MKNIRVFPRRTNASPDDKYAVFSMPHQFSEADKVTVSCTFTADKNKAEKMAEAWGKVAPTTIGGPAYDDNGGEFIPGLFIKKGYVITSRGCPNRCWFCAVPKREGKTIRELKIEEGHNILDSNILACSLNHFYAVCDMLQKQSAPVEFTGGLEAARLKWCHVDRLWQLHPKQMFFAYDTPDDYEPLIEAGKLLRLANFTRVHLRCYVLIGFKKDTFAEAEKRLMQTWSAGFMPMAMLWMDNNGKVNEEWKKFQRVWARPAIIKAEVRRLL